MLSTKKARYSYGVVFSKTKNYKRPEQEAQNRKNFRQQKKIQKMKHYFVLVSVVCVLFSSCQKNTDTAPTPPTTTLPNNHSIFSLPGIRVEHDAVYGTYLCIDSMESLHYLEVFLRNKGEINRITWESTIGFYSRESKIRQRMNLLADSLKRLEVDLEANDELYYELWSEYRTLQYHKTMTDEFDKLVNDKGYVMFCHRMWLIKDSISYLLDPTGQHHPYKTLRHRHIDPCYQSNLQENQYYRYQDTSSNHHLACIDRRMNTQLFNYQNCWGYSYLKARIQDDYMICDKGRWLPLSHSTLQIHTNINYEANGTPMHPDKITTKKEGASTFSWLLDSQPGRFCINDAYLEFSAYNKNLTPAKLEYTLLL